MKNQHVLSGLIAKRGELAGRVEALLREMRDVVAAIDHVDAAIHMFDPNANLDDIKPRLLPRSQAFKGEVARLVLNALRKKGAPMPVTEITMHVLAGRGLTNDDKPFVRILSKRVGACLQNLRKKGLVRLQRGDGPMGLWCIVT